MAGEILEATAVAFRRGTTNEISVFKGIEGEMVVDTEAKTLVMCDGEKFGGYPMARADMINADTTGLATSTGHTGKNLAYTDMSNMNSTVLATGRTGLNGDKNLTYADLTNLAHNTSNAPIVADILKTDYKLADTDLSNVDIRTVFSDYALANSSNINTVNLAEGSSSSRDPSVLGGNLAYADMSNVNTADLAEGTKHAGRHLLYTDLSNITADALKDYELISRKDSVIDEQAAFANNYPSTTAVINYVAYKIEHQGLTQNYAEKNLSNVSNWDAAKADQNSTLYKIKTECTSRGSNYSASEVLITEFDIDKAGTPLTIVIDLVSADGEILAFHTNTEKTLESFQGVFEDTKGAVFNVETEAESSILGGYLLSRDLSNIEDSLNMLKVTTTKTVDTNVVTLDLDHTKAQVYPVEITGSSDTVTITMNFVDDTFEVGERTQTYEVHVSVGDAIPQLTWVSTTSEPIKWLEDAPSSPVLENRTAMFIFRQQRGVIIANYAGSY